MKKMILKRCCGCGKSKLPPNFSWVLEDTLAGCGTPEKREELQALLEAGVTLLVSLSPEAPPHKAVSRLYMRGLKHEAFPCQEAEAVPLDTLLQVLDCVEKEVARGGRVAVHCRAGRGRTATVLAGYIMQVTSQYCILCFKHGLTSLACLLQVRLHPLAVDALNLVEQLRPEPPDEAWEQEEARIYPALRLLEDRAANDPPVFTIILLLVESAKCY